MQNSFIFHSRGLASDALTPASQNAAKRKLHAVIASDDCLTPFQAPFPNRIESPHCNNSTDTVRRMTKKAQSTLTINVPEKTSTTANVLPSPLSDNEPSTPTPLYARPQNQCASNDSKMESKFSSSTIVELLASEMMIVKEDIYRAMQEKLKVQSAENQNWSVSSKLAEFIHQQTHQQQEPGDLPHHRPVYASKEFLKSRDPDSHNALDFYCLLVAFITVYTSFLETSTSLIAANDHLSFLTSPLQAIMGTFHPVDNIFHHGSENLYLWYYLEQRELATGVNSTLQDQLFAHRFSAETAKHADIILSSFYTNHLLRIAAQKHQKDHGQFYTPASVVDFMWDTCMQNDGYWDRSVLAAQCPSVLDPCMGTGSFLSSYIQKIFRRIQLYSTLWSDADFLKEMMISMCSNIWGIEIDYFVLLLGKLNLMFHMFPACCRWMYINQRPIDFQLPRIQVFCNDILTLSLSTIDNSEDKAWEHQQVLKLRDPSALKLHFVVTNPPYMIRKTGFISIPDTSLYDMSLIGGRGTQAYMYFLWICLQRCHPLHGSLCFITPSQWILLEFAKNLRCWIWKNFVLQLVYQFEPYKIWPKIQTDSLIFLLRPRACTETTVPTTLFLRHMDRTKSLDQTLQDYRVFDESCCAKDSKITYKITPANPEIIFDVKDYSYAFLAPASNVVQRVQYLTRDLPRLCGTDNTHPNYQPPLSWKRGPNTNPVYALVIRTDWARSKFGESALQKWMRPAIYWNGKCDKNSRGQTKSKEILFWEDKDKQRLSQKENSPAEAYLPFRCPTADSHMGDQHYSMILIDNANTHELEDSNGQYQALYQYLKEAREKLQPTQTSRDIACCQFRQCGIEYPVKIVHPINFGYFSRTQPRQRFFLDTQRQCVTNQCMYFTIQPMAYVQDALFYLGVLNSTTIQFFIKIHCCYDQQGRTRFFARNMANIPFAPPSIPQQVEKMADMVRRMTNVRSFIYEIVKERRLKTAIEKLRQGRWDIECSKDCESFAHEDTSAMLPLSNGSTQPNLKRCPNKGLREYLRVAAYLQYGIDQLCYSLYEITADVQVAIESELAIQTCAPIEAAFPRQQAISLDCNGKLTTVAL
ncbi:hypothetical protein INT43_003203 [Umbelopsis isabellina]|uniref:site-specific DNA-methyltransferase (adenine-specific) n=1 Tax=Mortierella isabellina TaxID=91625 RepID=A0A8H7PQ05_MORIS|nr:hypothetical protein INT43_003203 [Umbelopsis isabellina]